MILVSYDGSADAQAAIDRVAQLMPGAEATVLTVWEPFVDTLTGSGSLGVGMAMVGPYADEEKIDAASREAALTSATDGTSAPRPPGSSRSRGLRAATATSRPRSSPRRQR